MKTKIIYKHIKNCNSVRHYNEGTWKHVWSFLKIGFGSKRSPFEKRGHTAWLIFRCNTLGCNALSAIHMDDVCTKMDQEKK